MKPMFQLKYIITPGVSQTGAMPQPLTVSAASGSLASESSGSDSGGSSPPRSVPAISSSGALPSGMKPDFIPK